MYFFGLSNLFNADLGNIVCRLCRNMPDVDMIVPRSSVPLNQRMHSGMAGWTAALRLHMKLRKHSWVHLHYFPVKREENDYISTVKLNSTATPWRYRWKKMWWLLLFLRRLLIVIIIMGKFELTSPRLKLIQNWKLHVHNHPATGTN